MSLHIAASEGDIASRVLLPGDPLRAKAISEKFFTNAVCYNEIRSMYGFTGIYNGEQYSVQGSGMGIPSLSIYVYELIKFFGVKEIIRVGTCGSIQPEVHIGDIILVNEASTDASHIKSNLPDGQDGTMPNFQLLQSAEKTAMELKIPIRIGGIFSTDQFYHNESNYWESMSKNGILGIEMESAALYSLGARYGIKVLSILTVSDHLLTFKAASATERESHFMDMSKIALNLK